MQATVPRPALPSADKRWKIVDATMRRMGYSPFALIETLHTAQEAFGYLDVEALRFVALSLRVPLSAVYGVATFYHHFSLKPQGEHTCVICTGTACHIKGAGALLQTIKEHHGVGAGETTPDGKISVVQARCLGSCGIAPVAVFDKEILGNVTPARTIEKLAPWRKSA